MNHKKVEEVDCCLISDDDEEACQILTEWSNHYESAEESFEWPEEESAGSSREMLEKDERHRRLIQEYAAKRKAQEVHQQESKKMRIAPAMNSPAQLCSVYAHKGDLHQGLHAARDIQLWQPFSEDYVRIFRRIPHYNSKDIVLQAQNLFSKWNWNSFWHPEQHLEIKVERIKDMLYKVIDVDKVEKNCIEAEYSSFGLESSQEFFTKMRADDELESEEYNTDDFTDDDDDVQFVGEL